MQNQFDKVMSTHDDEALIKITTIDREKYNPEAIEAAESEIVKRDIDTSIIEKTKKKITKEKDATVKTNSQVVSLGFRFLHYCIDSTIWIIILGICTIISGLFITTQNENLVSFIVLSIAFISFFGYYSIMEIKFQKTIGKFITKTKVVKLDGSKPTTSDIVTRTFCRLVPFDRISYLFVKKGIHDYLSKTMVIKDDK